MTQDAEASNDLRSRLTVEQFEVTQNKGTERPFTGKYVDNKDDGVYQCICCGAHLFSSDHKYDSGSGWPSFWIPLAGERVRTAKAKVGEPAPSSQEPSKDRVRKADAARLLATAQRLMQLRDDLRGLKRSADALKEQYRVTAEALEKKK